MGYCARPDQLTLMALVDLDLLDEARGHAVHVLDGLL
jgi:hypothetical protein